MSVPVYARVSGDDEAEVWQPFVRARQVDGHPEITRRIFGPRPDEQTAHGALCPCCLRPFAAGDFTTLVPLGPGDSVEARDKAVRGGWYTCAAIECHYVCVVGHEPIIDPKEVAHG